MAQRKPDFLHPENPPDDPLAWLITWGLIFIGGLALVSVLGGM